MQYRYLLVILLFKIIDKVIKLTDSAKFAVCMCISDRDKINHNNNKEDRR